MLGRIPKKRKPHGERGSEIYTGVPLSLGLNIKLHKHRVRFQKPGKEKTLR